MYFYITSFPCLSFPTVRAPAPGLRDAAAPFTHTGVPVVTAQCRVCPPQTQCAATSVPCSDRAAPHVLVTVQCHLLSPRGSRGPRHGHPYSWWGSWPSSLGPPVLLGGCTPALGAGDGGQSLPHEQSHMHTYMCVPFKAIITPLAVHAGVSQATNHQKYLFKVKKKAFHPFRGRDKNQT